MYDTATGTELGSFDTVNDTDDLFYDVARRRLYVSGGEGFVDVLQEQDPGGSLARLTFRPRQGRARRSSFRCPASILPFRIAETREPRFVSTKLADAPFEIDRAAH